MSTIAKTLAERGLVAQVTETGFAEAAARAEAEGPPLVVYAGFDPTGPSLHLGHLVPVFMLAHFQRHGHRPVVLVGGGTGMIGDPSGKADERALLSAEDVARNSACLKAQLSRFLRFAPEGGPAGPADAILVNNLDWLGRFGLLEFLRDVGKHFSVNVMLSRESVKQRLDRGLSFTEFSYQLLQGHDFYHLWRTQGCTVQIGGQDQWGNIVGGIDYIRRRGGPQAHGIVAPLVTRSDGRKFGKTEQGALWLDSERTSPHTLLQYWRNMPDADCESLLRRFTFLSLDAIAAIIAEGRKDPGARVPQKTLAREFVRFVHGDEAADAAEAQAALHFRGTEAGLSREDLEGPGFAPDANRKRLEPSALPRNLVALLCETSGREGTGWCHSRSEARRLIAQGAVRINGVKVAPDAPETAAITRDHLIEASDDPRWTYCRIQIGKKRRYLVVVRDPAAS